MAGDKPRDIKKSGLTAYERWELPVMDEEGNEYEARDYDVKPLTAADLEKIHDEAHAAGFEEGRKEGVAKGYADGYTKGEGEGFTKGHADGLEKGRVQAFKKAEAEIQENQARLTALMDSLLEPIKQSEEKVEEALLNLTLAICRSVISRELNMDSSHVARLVKESLAVIPDTAQQIKLYVNPKDETDAKAALQRTELEARVVVSDAIHAGGCKVETNDSLIDFTVEKRFQKTIQQILEKVSQQTVNDEAPDLADAMEDMTDFHRDILDSESQEEGEGVKSLEKNESSEKTASSEKAVHSEKIVAAPASKASQSKETPDAD